jgi:hypothetical protein
VEGKEERRGNRSGKWFLVVFNRISDTETKKRDCSLFYTKLKL